MSVFCTFEFTHEWGEGEQSMSVLKFRMLSFVSEEGRQNNVQYTNKRSVI